MKKKQQKNTSDQASAGFENLPDTTDFYAGGTNEQPLYRGRSVTDVNQVRKTDRHHAARGRPKENIDLRERMALLSLLKASVMILLLIIAFFMLWKGIKIYEESVWLESQDELEASPVMKEVVMIEDFYIEDQETREQFAERIELWKEAERLVQSAETLLQRNNYDQAIERCQDALRLDPAHMNALDQLGRLYYAKGMHVEAANAYIRLLSVDPSSEVVQKRLIEALDVIGDYEAVMHMAEWYLDENVYDVVVQRHLANALYARGNAEDAAAAYGKVLQELPKNVFSLERQADAYMQIEEYEKALVPLNRLREINYQNISYYKQLAICNAQLKQGYETIQILGRAAQIFGDKVVMAWMPDPQLDPVRDDRNFQAFIDHVGGEGFREWLDKMAKSIEASGKKQQDVGPMLTEPKDKVLGVDILQPQK
jgi:tetratricopeptide (TPR) repeat protein